MAAATAGAASSYRKTRPPMLLRAAKVRTRPVRRKARTSQRPFTVGKISAVEASSAAPARAALEASTAEIFPTVKGRWLVRAFLLTGLVLTFAARSNIGGRVFLYELAAPAVAAAILFVAVFDFALVRRGRLYFDDL